MLEIMEPVPASLGLRETSVTSVLVVFWDEPLTVPGVENVSKTGTL